MKRLALAWYLSAVWGFFLLLCIAPERALAVQYDRVIARTAQLVVLQANRNAVVNAVASTALATSPASVAVRMVAGPVGWAALAVSVGLALQQTYYSQQQLAEIKTAATPDPGGKMTFAGTDGQLWWVGPNDYGQVFIGPGGYFQSSGANSSCPGGIQYFKQGTGFGSPYLPVNWWFNVGVADWWCPKSAPYPAVQVPTQQQVATYVNSLPANDPKSVESHTTPNGVAVPVTPADNVTTVPINADQVTSTVEPSPHDPSAVIVATNVTPPAGTQATDTKSQTTSTTTTTTTNPDGSTTQQEQSSSNVSCIYGQHDGRTMSTVFQSHIATWQSSGLLALLTTFQTLTWPTALPTLSLQSNVFGTMSVNFNDWSAIFTSIRTLIIATTSFLAVRYVFAGGK